MLDSFLTIHDISQAPIPFSDFFFFFFNDFIIIIIIIIIQTPAVHIPQGGGRADWWEMTWLCWNFT